MSPGVQFDSVSACLVSTGVRGPLEALTCVTESRRPITGMTPGHGLVPATDGGVRGLHKGDETMSLDDKKELEQLKHALSSRRQLREAAARFEHAALKPLFLLNGGGLIVVLAFLGTESASQLARAWMKIDL